MKKALALAVLSTTLATPVIADELIDAVAKIAPEVSSWLNDPTVVDAVKAQNAAHAGLSDSDIIDLDNQWRAETEGGAQPLIEKVMGNPLSAYLTDVKDAAGGKYTEIFVMDNRGLNVGQSDVTSDYWQGDEGKWQNTYLKGPKSVDVSEVELDESTQTYQSQLSLPVVSGGEVIGAVTVGVNVDML